MAVCAGATAASVNGGPRFSRVTLTSWPPFGGSEMWPSTATLPTNQLFLVIIRTFTPLAGAGAGSASTWMSSKGARSVQPLDGRVHVRQPQRFAFLERDNVSQFRGRQRLFRRDEPNIGDRLPFIRRRLRPT